MNEWINEKIKMKMRILFLKIFIIKKICQSLMGICIVKMDTICKYLKF